MESKDPHRAPAVIWKKAMQEGTYPLPKLWILSLSMRFASAIGALNLSLFSEVTSTEDVGEDSCSKSCREDKSIKSSIKEEVVSECIDDSADKTELGCLYGGKAMQKQDDCSGHLGVKSCC